MRRLILLGLFLYSYAFDPVCEVFSDVLQTRDNPSKIVMSGSGYVYGTPSSCSFNTGSIYQGRWYPKLKCGSQTASATNNYSKSLSINYTFLVESSHSSNSKYLSGTKIFQSTNPLKYHSVTIYRNSTNITFKTPKLVIDNLIQSNSGWGSSTIIIYADEIDIGDINLGQQATLIIHPYTPNKKVILHSNSITSSSSSTIIVDSGDYYTNSFSIPGSSNISSIKASDNNQVINFFINNDFTPGNNPGINSDGNNGNFGTLSPANFRIFINGDLETGGGGTTFNALVYVENSAVLGSPTYIKGGLSTGGNIKIKNGSKFYYDTSIETSDLGGFCGNNFNFDNSYSCDIFPSVLTSYSKITTSSNTIYNSCQISVKDKNYIGNAVCNSCSNCSIIDSPKNRYSHNMFLSSKTDSHSENSNFTFSNLEYGNYIFNSNNQVIDFTPTNSYTDNSTKLMVLGDTIFDKNHQTLNFDGGDYYFNSFISNGNHLSICAKNDIRIFVKNNFELNGDNISTPCSGKIFVYTEKNAIFGHNGVGGNSDIHLYLYSKGDITFKNNSNITDIYGAITAEGKIDIQGQNTNFYYDASGLSNFGLGECSLCYDEHYLSTNGLSMFGMTMCSPFTPCEFDMPIKNTSNDKLDDVKIIETYKSSYSFGFSWFSYYDTIDKNGNHIGNGASKNSSSDYSLFNIIDTNLNTTAITYDFGDNYPTYSPGEDYYRAYKKDTMSMSFNFDFNSWKDSVVYLASFTDKSGREYNIQIDACPYVNEDKRPSGWLDAWDDYNSSRGRNDRNISTKVANKTFNLTLSFIPDSDVTTSTASVKYYLVDSNASSSHLPISPEDTLTILSNSYTTTIKSYSINKAYKNVNVEFKVCANYTSSGGYHLYPYANCATAGDCVDNFEENNICYRYFTSSDYFAIRPDKFDIKGDGYTQADKNISFLSIKAIGYLDSITNNYNENSSSLHIVAIDDLCPADNPTYSFQFNNGLAKIDYIKYPNVGEIELNISEKSGDEFAKVDSDDTLDKDRFIESTISNKITLIPDHFTINIDNVSNFNNALFTYLSNDLNMSAELNASIIAKNSNNVTTTNYKNGCYSKDIIIDISHHSNNSMNNLNKIVTQYSSNSKDDNISFNLSKDGFENGEISLNLMINFDRNSSLIVKPFDLILDNISVTDENNTIGNNSISQTLYFIYGKIKTEDLATQQDDVNISIPFEYYDNIWKINEYHTNYIYGAVNNYFTNSNKVSINLNLNNIDGKQLISVTPQTTNRPYRVILHLDIPSWLWYSKTGKSYLKPNSLNSDCLTHPCYNILFEPHSGSKIWSGEGTNSDENNVSTHTINSNIRQNVIKNDSYQRINW